MVTRTAQSTIDPGYQRLQNDFYQDVLRYTNRPFLQYGGDEIAPFSADQLAAFDRARALASSDVGAAELQMARDAVSGALTPIGQAQIDQYMSPYTQAVIDQNISDLDRAREISMLRNADAANRAGAFGGSRHGVIDAETNRNFADAVNRSSVSLRDAAYQNALAQANTDRTNVLAAGRQLANLGMAEKQRQLNDIGILSQIGGERQAMDQSQRTLDYQRFLDRRYYPERMLSIRQSALTGMPFNQRSVQHTPEQKNTFTQSLGGAGLGFGIARELFPSNKWAQLGGAGLGLAGGLLF